MRNEDRTFTAFVGNRLLAAGSITEVVARSKSVVDAGVSERVALFDDETGRIIDIDYTGSTQEVLARLAIHPLLQPEEEAVKEEKPRGPGRPKLGVVSREVSLLPRHWAWLAHQRGGASAALRKLVDEARIKYKAQEQAFKAKEAVHRFMWDMAGDFPYFEETTRAFFAKDYRRFSTLISEWPPDIRQYLELLLDRLLPLEEEAEKVDRALGAECRNRASSKGSC